ncbi:MAG: GIY-YIG nuclease family protein [Acidobacteriota bacterium]
MESLYVYIMSNASRVVYIGVTGNILQRYGEHSCGQGSQFTARHRLHRLVYFEQCFDPTQAIAREKQLKGWRRSKKVRLIESVNPEWNDLSDQL